MHHHSGIIFIDQGCIHLNDGYGFCWVDTSKVLNEGVKLHKHCGPEFSLYSYCCVSSTVSGEKLCCSGSICNVTTQALEGGRVDAWMSGLLCLWDGPVCAHRMTAGQAYVCATDVCATDTNAMKHRVNVIDSWAERPLAPFWFHFSLEVSSGNSDACYSRSAK